MLSEKQKIIAEYCHKNGEITKDKAVELIGGWYYCNERKHTGDVISRMVKRGLLLRMKRGVYKIGNLSGEKQQINDPDQMKLL